MKKIKRGGMLATIITSLCTSMTLAAQDIRPDFMVNGYDMKQSGYKSTEKPSTRQVVMKAGAGTTFPVDIPDNDSAGVDILIEATNFVGNIESVTLEIEMEHTYVSDLTATLTAPNGIARLVVFSKVGLDPDSDSFFGNDGISDLNGTYAFNDQATTDLWVEEGLISDSEVIPPGTYRTSTSGNPDNFFGGCTTRLNGAFGGLTPQQANGIWTLNIKDEAGFDTGQVLNVGLLVDEQLLPDDLIFSSSFQFEDQLTEFRFPQASDVLGECSKAQFDYTGTGFSDYAFSLENDDDLFVQIHQNNGSGLVGPITFLQELPTSLSFNPQMTSGGDFDGDGIQDIVFSITQEVGVLRFLVRRSSRPDDLLMNVTTSEGFDPQFGDYDGDGLDDIAGVFHDDGFGTSQAVIVDSSLSSGVLTSRGILIGAAGPDDDHRTAGGFDHNGDGIADISVLTVNGTGRLVDVFSGVDGSVLLDSSTIFTGGIRQLPGNFLAPNSSGISTVFPAPSAFNFQAREEDLSAVFRGIIFGDGDGTADPITGDYDGDGLDDFGLWIPNTDNNGFRFSILPSSSADPQNNLIEVFVPDYGTNYPLGNSRVR